MASSKVRFCSNRMVICASMGVSWHSAEPKPRQLGQAHPDFNDETSSWFPERRWPGRASRGPALLRLAFLLGPGFCLSGGLPATAVLRTLGQIPFAFGGHLQTLRRAA